jgi:transcription initiation factor TFIIIB Brf1 subunit/transcription initiation factor TFIIB
MNEFELYNDDEFEEFINNINMNEINDISNTNNYKKCIECNIQMQPNINNTLTCPNCGYIKNVIIENLEYEPSMTGYNTNQNYHIPIKCIGKNAFQYQKYLRNNTSEYSIIQETTIRRILEKLNYNSDTFIIPKNIINNVLNQYKKIRETSKIHRGEILKGIIGSLLYYECLKEGIIRKPKELAKWYNISENDLSKGDKILRELEENKIIELPINKNFNNECIDSYLKRINIDIKYHNFLNELLDRINILKIGNPNARLSTKIASLIFLLIISNKNTNFNHITPTHIADEFDISISTFKSFYTEVYKKINKIQDILDKYLVVLPNKIPRKPRCSKKNKDE